MKTNHSYSAFFIAIIFLLAPAVLPAQPLWSLEGCIQHAMENNIQIRQSRLLAKSAALDVEASKWSFVPSVNASSDLNFNWAGHDNNSNLSNSYGLNASVPLFGGFQKWHQHAKSKIDKDISLVQAAKVEKNIELNITAYYLNILYNKEMLAVAKQQLMLSKMQVERSAQLVEAGKVPKGNLLEIQSQAATEQTNVVKAYNQLALAYLDLKQLLDMPADTDFEIDTTFVPNVQAIHTQASDKVYVQALHIMPEIKEAQLSIMSAQRAEKIAKGALLPSISLSGGLQTAYYDNTKSTMGNATQGDFWSQIDDNTGKFIGLSLNVPIFNGLSARHRVKKAQINSLNQAYTLDLQKNSLRKTIEKQYQDAIAALQTYDASRKSVSALQQAFEYSQARFDVGKINPVEYNTAKIKLTAAQSQLLRAKYDYVFKNKILDYYMGIPLRL